MGEKAKMEDTPSPDLMHLGIPYPEQGIDYKECVAMGLKD